ncbi:BgTH12-03712 [Blumeria graminis f. sp. triticale]|uniref:BgtA-21503 n=3 Tax=Blumeria graminis TaxID=34373 RepID=A0A9X9L9A9_BLUGR|nr:hypothetical protein BGT96224_A21503 [Blumeria graminis f. sp. tritici 96224]CAD6499602.1 BgTH12-03712 [Blumeria graminis f. sp. triticale]VCU39779.1 BgtA-21503 [Blumeria graminis f. sp. tritici]
MAEIILKKRKSLDGSHVKSIRSSKKIRTQQHSKISSDDEDQDLGFKPVSLQDSDNETSPESVSEVDTNDHTLEPRRLEEPDGEEVTDGSNSDSESDGSARSLKSNPNLIKKNKSHDPNVFAKSMSRILDAKLSSSKRSDPVLARSFKALEASKEITDAALDKKARNKLRAAKREALDKGRVKDILGTSQSYDVTNNGIEGPAWQETAEMEVRLRKTAQKGVVKLFNAVRAAQVKAEEAAKEARASGLVGQGNREHKVNEMSKRGFLDLIARGGEKESLKSRPS